MPLTRDKIEQKVASILIEQLGVDESQITPNANLVHDLDCDSLDLVELVISMEEAFEFEVTDEEGEKVRTVKDACDLIERKAS